MVIICCHNKTLGYNSDSFFSSQPLMKPESVASTPAAIHLALLINMLSMGCMMMVMPLGPELVTRLGMLPEQTGYFSGGATLGAACWASWPPPGSIGSTANPLCWYCWSCASCS